METITQYYFDVSIIHQYEDNDPYMTTHHYKTIYAPTVKDAFIKVAEWSEGMAKLYRKGEIKSITRM